MKRSLIRLTTLTSLVVLGLITIAYAQRGTEDNPPASTVELRGAPAEAPGEARGGDPSSAPSDPFSGGELPSRGSAFTGGTSPYASGDEPSGSRYSMPGEDPTGPSRPAGSMYGAPPITDQEPTQVPIRSADRAPAAHDQGTPTVAEPGSAYESGSGARLMQPASSYPTTGGTADRATDNRVAQLPPRTAQSGGSSRYSGNYSNSNPTPSAGSNYGSRPRIVSDTTSSRDEVDPFDGPATLSAPSDATAMPGRSRAYGGSPIPPEETRPVTEEGTGVPGAKGIEGRQSPTVSIQKLAPTEMQVGRPAMIEILVRNSGQFPVHQLQVMDEVPRGTTLLETVPAASRDQRGRLLWTIGTMQPTDEMKLLVKVMPVTEGEVGGVAMVRYSAEASARSIVTRPVLVVQTSAPRTVMIDETCLLSIRIANTGTGVATGVVIRERLPAGLSHPAGEELEYEVGELAPNESRELELELTATQAGRIMNELFAYADGNLQAAPARTPIDVVAPGLAVAADGPKRRYLERPAVYTVAVSNPGTAAAERVQLVAKLPAGMKFLKADNSGRYDPETRTVVWLMEQLPPQRTGTVTLNALPIEPGAQQIMVQAEADRGLTAVGSQETVVEGVAAVLFQVADVDDPIEIGGDNTYEIRVVNQGSKTATNVTLVAHIPDEMKVVAAEGPTRHAFDGRRISFEPIPRLAPKADTTYRVRVRGIKPGDVRFRVQLVTDEMEEPVIKEESTRVYADE